MPITYKCPNCGAAMEFDSTAQKLKCPSCQMEMDVQDYEKQYGHLYSDAEAGENAQSAQSAQSEGQKGKGSMNMKVYHPTPLFFLRKSTTAVTSSSETNAP